MTRFEPGRRESEPVDEGVDEPSGIVGDAEDVERPSQIVDERREAELSPDIVKGPSSERRFGSSIAGFPYAKVRKTTMSADKNSNEIVIPEVPFGGLILRSYFGGGVSTKS